MKPGRGILWQAAGPAERRSGGTGDILPDMEVELELEMLPAVFTHYIEKYKKKEKQVAQDSVTTTPQPTPKWQVRSAPTATSGQVLLHPKRGRVLLLQTLDL